MGVSVLRQISTRWLVAAALVGLVATGMVAGSSPKAADASASGCTNAPGYSGALNCIDVQGSGLSVTWTVSRYQPGITKWPVNNCYRLHEWRYYLPGSSSPGYKTRYDSSCQWGTPFNPSMMTWVAYYEIEDGLLKEGSSLCAHTNNTHTGFRWSNYACVTIKK